MGRAKKVSTQSEDMIACSRSQNCKCVEVADRLELEMINVNEKLEALGKSLSEIFSILKELSPIKENVRDLKNDVRGAKERMQQATSSINKLNSDVSYALLDLRRKEEVSNQTARDISVSNVNRMEPREARRPVRPSQGPVAGAHVRTPLINRASGTFRNTPRHSFASILKVPPISHSTEVDDLNLMAEKQLNLVIKRIPEAESIEETERQDKKMVEAILRESAIDISLIKEIRRHPLQRRPNARRYMRPLKVMCYRKEDRDLIYDAIVRTHAKFLPHGAYVRADLTPVQLRRDARLRAQCRIWNDEVGWRRFMVRNLEILDREKESNFQGRTYRPNWL